MVVSDRRVLGSLDKIQGDRPTQLPHPVLLSPPTTALKQGHAVLLPCFCECEVQVYCEALAESFIWYTEGLPKMSYYAMSSK